MTTTVTPSSLIGTPSAAPAIAPLRDFVVDFGRLLDTAPDEARILAEGGALLRKLVARDDWLPDAFARPDCVAENGDGYVFE